ncbi:glycosyltransferase family 4 protein [Rheinheimera sp.]|uniref:glycosyltransferase family 4 protein n=1 Tax=Rheinheimera sp. TaxID=1869214 RepID=UPI00307F3441
MNPRILILTNMGPKASAPFQGQFVRTQMQALSALMPVLYFYMSWHSDSRLNRLLKYPVLFLQFVWRYVLSRHRLDLLHVHFFYPTIFLAIFYKLVRNPRVKIMVTCHGSDIYYYEPFSTLYRWSCGWVDQWLYSSEKLKQRAWQAPAEAPVISAGIDATFAQTEFLSRAQKDIDLLYVGALDQNKGMDRLIRLLPALADYTVVLVGKGPYQSRIEQAIQLYPNVQLLGPKSSNELKALYQRARCFLSLSRNESFGLVMTEAMACYTPVIATQTDGSMQQLADRPEWLIPQQTEAELDALLLEKIQQLLSLPDSDYQALQQVGREQAQACLVTEVARRVQRIYLNLLGQQE